MAGCNSDATSGCSNNDIVAAIDAQTTTLAALVTAGNVLLTEIKVANAACCVLTNEKLQTEIDLLTAINAKL